MSAFIRVFSSLIVSEMRKIRGRSLGLCLQSEQSRLLQLCYSCKCDIYSAYSVPCLVVDYARLREIEYLLELADCRLRTLAVDSVDSDFRYVAVGVRYGV